MFYILKNYKIFVIICVIIVLCYNYLTLYFDVQQMFFKRKYRNDKSTTKYLLLQENKDNLKINSYSTSELQKEYLILVWKFGQFLERRHIRRFSKHRFSPWENCSIKSCKLSYDDKDLNSADAVIFHLHMTESYKEIPFRENYHQRWIFLTDESPLNTFLHRKQDISDYNGLFNWSMTYRSDSDISVPYGKAISLEFPNSEILIDLPEKTKLLAIMGSNCGGNNNRWTYVSKLKKLLGNEFDIFGRCQQGNTTACPGRFDRDCLFLEYYKFYLAFENSNCREYMTEKLFWNAYGKFAVPIIMGASKDDCKKFLPPYSYLHISDFASPSTLADYIKYLNRNEDEYLKYHEWRKIYRILNEHGYFGSQSYHYCRVCEALHNDDGNKKIYSNLSAFWNKKTDCDIQ